MLKDRIIRFFKFIIGTDGLLHILCSYVLVQLFYLLFPMWLSCVWALLVGVLKELLWDKYLGRGDASWHDIICDAGGILIGMLVLYLLIC